MKILITGITGMTGSYLAEYLLKKESGAELYGTIRWRSPRDNIASIQNDLRLVECDIRDLSSVRRVIETIKPDIIFHLAAQSNVYTSWHAPAETLTTNIVGELNLLEAVRACNLNPVIHIPGSSEEYGMVLPEELPVKETNPLRPLSPYGVSKVGQDLLAYQYHMSYGLSIVRSRSFNHTAPRRGDVFVEANFARQIAEIEAGLAEPILRVGNLNVRRDYTDVRDMVRAYWLLTQKGHPGEVYNICSGRSLTIQQIMEILIGMSSSRIEPRVENERLRPSDAPYIVGDNSRFCDLTGWKAEIPMETTLRDILDFWRLKVGRKNGP